jgi:hypothetical protein
MLAPLSFLGERTEVLASFRFLPAGLHHIGQTRTVGLPTILKQVTAQTRRSAMCDVKKWAW